MRKKLLVIEDNKRVLEILAFALGREGYQIMRADNGPYGFHLAKEYHPDLIILDLEQKEPDKFDICRELREAGIHKPILLFLSSEKEANMLSELGLSIGYIQTPFHMKELLMLINVNIWDAGGESNSGSPAQFLAFGRIEVDTEQVLVLKDGLPIELTQKEYDLICCLASEPGRVFSREELLELVWGYTYMGDSRPVDTTISRLREKIEDVPSRPKIIVARRGRGYVFTGQT
nr:response regulator transcription factor [uncultured Oscillibacter sp.]